MSMLVDRNAEEAFSNGNMLSCQMSWQPSINPGIFKLYYTMNARPAIEIVV